MKHILFLSCVIAMGCGSSKETSAPENKGSGAPVVASGVEKPSPAETTASIREFFTDPGTGVGYLSVDVQSVSEPIPAPRELVRDGAETWAVSVTMSCDNVIGDKMLNKHWLILIGREQGKAKVKEYYNDLIKMSYSPAGKEWFAQTGFREPSVE